MKRILFLSFALTALCPIQTNSMPQPKAKIGVIADPHYTHPSLIVEKGKALDAYLSQDRKLLLESDAVLRQTVHLLLQEDVNLVLIPGDLTKDGEKMSHLGVAEILQPLREKGVKVLVIPGNHDIDNPDAVSFHGDKTRRAETVSPQEFAQIYADYGFADAVSRDEHSLSYVSEPVDGFRVICIDGCRYYDNTFASRGHNKDFCVTHGAIKPETMMWIRTEMQVAQILGKQVVAMVHHNVVEHFDHQSLFASPYLIDNHAHVQQEFLRYGINVLFTGHFHSSDIAMVSDADGNSLYEIETGSIVTYPCPYRIIRMAGNSLEIETKYIEEIDYPLPHGMDFPAFAKLQIEIGFHEMVSGLIHEYHSELVGYIPKWVKPFVNVPDAAELVDLLTTNLSSEAVNLMLAHYSGNEHQLTDVARKKEEAIAGLNNFIRGLCRASAGRFAGIAEKIIQRTDVVKKAKSAIASIWDNQTSVQLANGFIYNQKPVNDLYLTLDMRPTEETNALAHIPRQETVYLAP